MSIKLQIYFSNQRKFLTKWNRVKAQKKCVSVAGNVEPSYSARNVIAKRANIKVKHPFFTPRRLSEYPKISKNPFLYPYYESAVFFLFKPKYQRTSIFLYFYLRNGFSIITKTSIYYYMKKTLRCIAKKLGGFTLLYGL